MLDPILRQSIHRWENEGGLYAVKGNQTFEATAWNKSYQSRNEINRDGSGRSSRMSQNLSDPSKPMVKAHGTRPAKGTCRHFNQSN